MAVQIRQEINILDNLLSTTVADITAKEVVQLNTTQYNGTVTYYLEIVAFKGLSTGSGSVSLRRSGTSTDDATIDVSSIPLDTADLIRSNPFTPPAGQTGYTIFIDYVNVAIRVKSARIIVIQNATTLTNTETQIEIGNYNLARTAETATILVNPKYWKYDASKWDGATTFYAEAVYDSGDMDTISVYIYESAAIDAPSWSSVATIVSAGTTTVPTRTRVAFTPVDGRWYTIYSLNGSMDNHDIYRAGIVVQQVANSDGTFDYYFDASDNGPTDTDSAWLNDSNAFDGNIATYADLNTNLAGEVTPTRALTAEGTNASGTDNISKVEVRFFHKVDSGSTAGLITDIYIDGTLGGSDYIVNISHPVTGLFEDWTGYSTINAPSGGWTLAKVQALECLTYDPAINHSGVNHFSKIEIRVTKGSITKLEPQYLLANTLFAAGTALQTFLTKWDSTEWTGVTNAYTGQAEAANGSTSDVLIQEADAGSTVATINNIDNAGQAAATMPTSQNLDCLANANAGDVAATRILVAVVVNATSTIQTINGLAKASVKTVNGLAIASVKTINGLG